MGEKNRLKMDEETSVLELYRNGREVKGRQFTSGKGAREATGVRGKKTTK